ncbi:MAG: hypothetical protein NZM07_07050, partial [Elioraea sp.]|nr:hypothetical protein [Elioraea sp.]
MNLSHAAIAVTLVVALAATPTLAQTYAPAPRALTPAAPAPADVCAPAPQGQGSASPACHQECSRDARYSPHCPSTGAAPAP